MKNRGVGGVIFNQESDKDSCPEEHRDDRPVPALSGRFRPRRKGALFASPQDPQRSRCRESLFVAQSRLAVRPHQLRVASHESWFSLLLPSLLAYFIASRFPALVDTQPEAAYLSAPMESFAQRR